MTTQYAFYFDARYCSGCKACQAACKDKNNLPAGVLWRRVAEVSGGGWHKEGDAWVNTVFAYNMSLACNHCVHPKCAGVCPTKAFETRADGIVFLDTSKCIGCGYCSWACPYEVPQYHATAGHMTKCDFCLDHLEQGLPPACVAACPLRVLEYGEATTREGAQALWATPPETHPFPLPKNSHSEPHLAITPHPGMSSTHDKHLANLEEFKPLHRSKWEELPLLAFTLLAQLAVGGFWAMTWMFPTMDSMVGQVIVGVSLVLSVMISFAHLGTKKNAWRILANVRKSSLSKEILFLSLFAASWLFTTLATMSQHQASNEFAFITSVLGIGLIYNMSQVYRIPAARGWNKWQTNASFMLSALVMGIAVMSPVLSYASGTTSVQVHVLPWTVVGASVLILLLAQLTIMYTHPIKDRLSYLRTVLILIAMALSIIGLTQSHMYTIGFGSGLFFLVILEETIGRWSFYESRLLDQIPTSKPILQE